MVFTGATTNAGRIIDHGITAPVAVLDHRDGLRQAMACTIAADNAIPRDEALLLLRDVDMLRAARQACAAGRAMRRSLGAFQIVLVMREKRFF